MDHPGDAYPDDLSLLSRAEEVRLARAVEAGLLARAQRESGVTRVAASATELRTLERLGAAAQRRMVAANLGLVGLVVHRTTRPPEVGATDLFQDGCVGLIDAVRRFDHARGHRFATYALIRIRAAVSVSAYRAQAGGGLTVDRVRQQRRLRRAEAELTQQLGRSARPEEVAGAIGRHVDWVNELLVHDAAVPIEVVADTLLGTGPAPSHPRELSRLGVSLLERLSPTHRRVLELRYGFGPAARSHSLREIAELVQTSLGVVRRLEREGLDELRARCPVSARAWL